MITTSKFVWLFATMILLSTIQVLCNEVKVPKVSKREQELLNNSTRTCTGNQKPKEEGCLVVVKGENGESRIASYLGYAKEGDGCLDKNATRDNATDLCLRSGLEKGKECIHSDECFKGGVCIPGPTPNPDGGRVCQSLSMFLKPNYYIVTILAIFLIARM